MNINEMINEFLELNINNTWLPVVIVIYLIFGAFVFNFAIIYRSALMDKVLFTHGFKSGEKYSYNKAHFHNTDTLDGFYDVERDVPETNEDWTGRDLLFIPIDKVNTIKKDMGNITIWYKGHNSKGVTYYVKKLQKNWKERILTKKNIYNYNGSFIISNLMVRTLNLTSLRIDSSRNNRFVLTYLFDNGTKYIQKLSPENFFADMVHRAVPYNFTFLKSCEMIELR